MLQSDIFDREDNDLWNRAHVALRKTTPKSASDLSAPKVDLYVALPILSNSFEPRGFCKDDSIQNFNPTRLARLGEKGLISCPIASLSSRKPPGQKHLVCFPSAVIEAKHHDVTEKEKDMCYWQAANASSSAVAMLSKLAAYPKESFSVQIVRPVVSFTFIGPKVKVWITYISSKETQNEGEQPVSTYVSEHLLRHCTSKFLIFGLSADAW